LSVLYFPPGGYEFLVLPATNSDMYLTTQRLPNRSQLYNKMFRNVCADRRYVYFN